VSLYDQIDGYLEADGRSGTLSPSSGITRPLDFGVRGQLDLGEIFHLGTDSSLVA